MNRPFQKFLAKAKRIKLTTFQYRMLTGAVISALLLMACAYLGIKFKDQAAAAIYRETTNTARLLLSHFEEVESEIDSRLKLVAEYFAEKDFDDIRDVNSESEFHKLLKMSSGAPIMTGPGIFDKSGFHVASGSYFPVPKTSIAELSTFRIHAQNIDREELYISPSVVGPLTGERSILFSRALRNKSGEFKGVALCSYKLSNFADLYRSLRLTEHGQMALNGTDGLSRIRIVGDRVGYEEQERQRRLALPLIRQGQLEGALHRIAASDGILRIGSYVASKKIPFYVVAAYNEEYFRQQYIGSWIFLGGAWLGISGVMFGLILYRSHTERIRREAETNLAHQAEVVAATERQNILADLHDSIGSSLATMLAAVDTGKIDLARHKHRLSETLNELRLLVDTFQGESSDINLMFASLRHRMERAIERSGTKLHWQINELPQIKNFSARDAFMLKLILLEAISNVLHHSRAKDLVIKAVHDSQAAALIVSVSDNGCGFDPAIISDTTIGLNNMRKRATRISTGAKISIQSVPGKGTTVCTELALSPSPRG
jgi:signal transduction histidine kinase